MDLLARNRFRPVCREHRSATDIAALLADGLGAAIDHIVDQRGVEPVAIRQRPKRGCRQFDGSDFAERSIWPPAPPGGSYMVVDQRVGQAGLPLVLYFLLIVWKT